MEVIAVTGRQATALRRAAEKRAKGRGTKGNVAAYFQLVEGAVPKKTNSGSSCARHRLVRVVRGLRKAANINHKAMGRVVFARGTRLARKHPRGVACYMMPSGGGHDPMERAMSSGSSHGPQRVVRPRVRTNAMRRGPRMDHAQYQMEHGEYTAGEYHLPLDDLLLLNPETDTVDNIELRAAVDAEFHARVAVGNEYMSVMRMAIKEDTFDPNNMWHMAHERHTFLQGYSPGTSEGPIVGYLLPHNAEEITKLEQQHERTERRLAQVIERQDGRNLEEAMGMV
jgi:hypothetical protein